MKTFLPMVVNRPKFVWNGGNILVLVSIGESMISLNHSLPSSIWVEVFSCTDSSCVRVTNAITGANCGSSKRKLPPAFILSKMSLLSIVIEFDNVGKGQLEISLADNDYQTNH